MLAVDVSVPRRDLEVTASFTVEDGRCVALFGPSGAGKSTVLEAIAGLAPLRRGAVELDGQRLSAAHLPPTPLHRRRVGFLPQEPLLFPHRSVRENLCWSRPVPAAELEVIVADLGLGGLLDARPDALSGGQARRVALGRLLLSDYRVLLLDEPASGLDRPLRGVVERAVEQRLQARPVPVVLVTHDLEEAQARAEVVVVMKEGRALQIAAPLEVVTCPVSLEVAQLVGYGPVLDAAWFSAGLPIGARQVVVHPDHLRVGSDAAAGPTLAGTVVRLRARGPGLVATCRVGEVELGVPLGPGDDLEVPLVGASIEITCVRPVCFDAAGRRLAPSPPVSAGRHP